MIKKSLATAVLATTLVTGVLVPAAPAQAAASDCNSYSNVVCLIEHGDFTGRVWRQTTGQFPTGCRNLTGYNNITTVGFNRTSNYAMRLYADSNCTGTVIYFSPGQVRSFTYSNQSFNDRASSIGIRYVP
jgi:hypothetical protein